MEARLTGPSNVTTPLDRPNFLGLPETAWEPRIAGIAATPGVLWRMAGLGTRAAM